MQNEAAEGLYANLSPGNKTKSTRPGQTNQQLTAPQPSRSSQATQLVELAQGAELFHTPDQEAYISFDVNGHRENCRLKTKAVRQWLARRFYVTNTSAPGSQALQDAINVLEGKALYEGQEQAVFVRLAEQGGSIYLDLANEQWAVVEVTTDGWRVVHDPPVKFRRARGMECLPVPVNGGTIEDLRPFVNVAENNDWVLLVAWLVAALRPRGPYPVLTLHGEQGSAKSWLARILRSLVDPNTAPLRSEPHDVRDVMIAASNGWCLAFDNLSHIEPWLSDVLCRLATGGGFATRELYSDGDEALFVAQRPVMLNGIEELATRGDLLDRAVILYLPMISEEKRSPEAALVEAFEVVRPRILGALLSVVAGALRGLPEVKLSKSPRMADFAVWVTAAESSLAWPPGTFITAYTGNRDAANELTLEASMIAAEVRKFVAARQQWQGTSADLLKLLTEQADGNLSHARGWPSSPKALSSQLRRVMPNLRAVGISVGFCREPTHERRRLILLERVRTSSSEPSEPSDD